MRFKKIVLCATCATMLLGSTQNMCGLKDEAKKEKSAKKDLVSPLADAGFAAISLIGIVIMTLCAESLEKMIGKMIMEEDQKIYVSSIAGRLAVGWIGSIITLSGLCGILENSGMEIYKNK